MNNINLQELKDFERLIKEKIITQYESELPKHKIDYILQKEYANEKTLKKKKEIEKYHGDLIRNVFTDLINPNDDNAFIHSLAEYYAIDFSNENKILINDRPDLKSKLKSILKAKKILNNDLNVMAFNDDYMNIVSEGKNINNKDIIPFIKLVYKDSEQYIEYYDENNEKHCVKSDNPEKVSRLYKTLINDNVDAKEIFNKLVKNNNENQSSNKEVNILDYVNSNNTNNNLEDKFFKNNAMPFKDKDDDNDDNSDATEFSELMNQEKFQKFNHLEDNENNSNAELNNINNEEFIDKNDFKSIPSFTHEDYVNSKPNIENEIIATNYEETYNNKDYSSEENKLENIKFRESLDSIGIKENSEYNSRKNDLCMFFYILSITISLALIIAILFLKYYN